MNLIYIYVDNYKILKDKEITLSSNYNVTRCENSFIINDTSISDGFYGYNLDVISIFGKNGSGKSTIIELITLILSSKIPLLTEVVCLYEYMGEFYYFTNKSEFITVEYKSYLCPEIHVDEFFESKKDVIYFSHHVEPLASKLKFKNTKSFKYYDCSNQKNINKMARKDFSNWQVNLCFNLFKKYNMTRYGMKDDQ